MNNGIYVASRASLPARVAMWQRLRSAGWNITSTWIDEAGPGQTRSMEDLWDRIRREIASSAALILYADKDDFPLKGALVEVGMAIGLGKPVGVVLGPSTDLERETMRPLGSWVMHPLVVTVGLDLEYVREMVLSRAAKMAADPAVVVPVRSERVSITEGAD